MILNDILDGRFCVYLHSIDNAIFYVGSGRVTRAFECVRTERSRAWHEFRANRPVTVTLFEFFDDPNEARRKEYRLIKSLKPLANIHGRERPAPEKTIKFKAAPKPKKQKPISDKPKRLRKGKAIYAQELGKGPRVLYNSGKEAAEKLGIPASYISRCLRGFRKEFGGYRFWYAA